MMPDEIFAAYESVLTRPLDVEFMIVGVREDSEEESVYNLPPGVWLLRKGFEPVEIDTL